MFSKFIEIELEEVHRAQQDPVFESSSMSILRSIFLVQNLQCPKFPLPPMPWGWISSAKWMASSDLKEDGQQQQSKQEACRGWYCVGGKLQMAWANPSFQAPGSTTDSPATACPDSQKVPELPGQRPDANEQLPAGTSVTQLKVKQLKEEREQPQMGARA